MPQSSENLPPRNLQPGNPLPDVILIDPNRLGGVPVFMGTRVPVRSLFEYLRGGETVETFLDEFPGVRREHVEAVLDAASANLIDRLEVA